MELNKGVSKNNSRMKTVQAYFCFDFVKMKLVATKRNTYV